MQTFSNMRRSGSYKHIALVLALLVGFYAYESVASMRIFLPPLLGVCLCLFLRFDSEDKFYRFLCVCVGLLLIESENSLPLGTLLVLFFLLGIFVIPRIQAVLSTQRVAKASYVALAYGGFYLLASLIDSLWGSAITPSFWIVLYYILLEMCVAIFL